MSGLLDVGGIRNRMVWKGVGNNGMTWEGAGKNGVE